MTLQNIFSPGKYLKTISKNVQILILFSQAREGATISSLAQQIDPTARKFIISAFHLATQEQWGYLVCDLRPQTPISIRYSSKIFPFEPTVVFLPT